MNKIKLFTLLLLTLFGLGVEARAQELNAAGTRFRTSIQTFLKEEGCSPSLNQDGSISFTYHETDYMMVFGGGNPTLVSTFLVSPELPDEFDKTLLLQAVNHANGEVSCAKAVISNNCLILGVEMLCHVAEEFKYVFYKNMASIETLGETVGDTYDTLESQAGPGTSSSTAAKPSTSPAVKSSSTGVDKLFPVYGITLGQTTVADLERMGYKVDKKDNGKNVADVHDIWFWDHDMDKVIEYIYMTRAYDNIPASWQSTFSWSMSYNEMLATLKSLGLDVTVVKSPDTRKYDGRSTLSAELTAYSPDKNWRINVDFDYGNRNGEGYSVNSKNTLYSIIIDYDGPIKPSSGYATSAPSSTPTQSANGIMSMFFPVNGVMLGKTTVSDLKKMGYDVENNPTYHYCRVNGLQCYDWNNDNVIEDVSIYRSTEMPAMWKSNAGLSWDMSYNEIMAKLKSLGLNVAVIESPTTEKYNGRNTLKAKLHASHPSCNVVIKVNFEQGNSNNEGCTVNSKNSIKSIYFVYE